MSKEWWQETPHEFADAFTEEVRVVQTPPDVQDARHLLHQQYERPEQQSDVTDQQAEGNPMQQDGPEIVERRNLGGNFEASLLATGGLVLTLESGSAAILKAEQVYNLLDFLDEHRLLLQQKSQGQEDGETEVQKEIVRDWLARSHHSSGDQAQERSDNV